MGHEYVMSFEDFRNAQNLYFRHRRAAGIRLRLWLYGLPALAVALVIADVYLRRSRDPDAYDPLLGAVVFFVILSVWVIGSRRWQLRRCFKRILPPGQAKEALVQFDFDDQGVVSSIPGRSEGRFFWAGILDYVEDDEMALLFVRKKNFLFVPKRAMDDPAWERLRAYVRQHGIGNNPC